jgi:hypothetical protein
MRNPNKLAVADQAMALAVDHVQRMLNRLAASVRRQIAAPPAAGAHHRDA